MEKNIDDFDFNPPKKITKKWYQLSNKKIAKILDTNLTTGLTNQEVERRLKIYGLNHLPQSKKHNFLLVFLKTFLDPLCVIMALTALVTIIANSIEEKFSMPDIAGLCVIGLIILTNSIISTYQEMKSLNYISSLDTTQDTLVSVLRDGEIQQINPTFLVPGDVVHAKLGEFIPADLRIINESVLKIDESSLTGESEPVEKIATIIKEDNLIISDQKNMAFMSTMILEGKLVGIVLKTGTHSEIGKIASKITKSEFIRTPLEKKTKGLTIRIGIIAFIFGLILLLFSFFIRNQLPEDLKSWSTLLLLAVSAAISVIPESLTIIVRLCMTIATKKLSKNNVDIKNPKSIETLGNVNVICSDKTGTLTQNKMDIDQFFVDLKAEKDPIVITHNKHFLNALALCNDVVCENTDIIGSATEVAIIKFLIKQNFDYSELRKNHPRVDEIPFDSKRKMMTTVHQDQNDLILYTKGAFDYLLKHSTKKIVNGVVSALTKKDRDLIQEQSFKYAQQGLRVLGIAYKNLNSVYEEYETDLIFIGVIGIIDPPRPEVKMAIENANKAGVRVIMITGDHKITAQEIATRLGIYTNYYNQVMDGAELDTLSDEELAEKIKTTNVFARVSPEHKAIIVRILQANNNIVAMTGDGINDTPSIVKADVGIAMGINGTQVTKEVSDVILKDDNFKSIVFGIRAGRNVYEKIKYSISFLIAANISQVLTILFILLINKDIALISINILFHILIIETIVAIPIGMQYDRKGVMFNPPPSHKKESLLKGIKMQIIITTVFNAAFAVLNYEIVKIFNVPQTFSEEFSKTGVYMTIMISPILYSLLFNNFFLPINHAGIVKPAKEKFILNKRLLFFSCLALIITIISLLPVKKINDFFDFKTIDLPLGLLAVYLVNTLLVVPCIWLSYYIFLKSKNLWFTKKVH
ncbi:cation-translocating P-type ATPase [Williamsoniiplasma luminosum]|uniref:Cation-translocating P-type ATPase n=1 Tax=Williamsoniiplasma luminosum TaxID=214888 RepID=A0A2S0NKR7_9MOLU|nr:HAD-IC family P-type ATPase [Williamsoniiplasma luminosum]AVP49604.1 MAG: cation-translocating P-type ATPase [Williamsoniiplasma luminosum]